MLPLMYLFSLTSLTIIIIIWMISCDMPSISHSEASLSFTYKWGTKLDMGEYE